MNTQARLSRRIAEAGLSPEVQATFEAGLREIATLNTGQVVEAEILIRRLLGPSDEVDPAPFEALWPHAMLFLRACIYVAVVDGEYSIAEARLVSHHAHRLGLSARQLAGLEAETFREIQARAAQRGARRGTATGRQPAAPVVPTATQPNRMEGNTVEETIEIDALDPEEFEATMVSVPLLRD